MTELKSITRKFKKFHLRRHPKLRNMTPHTYEIGMFIKLMLDKGYAPLKNSITIRDISFPGGGPMWQIWGWFVFVGKRKVDQFGIINPNRKNISIPDVDFKFICEAVGTFILSDEAKEIKIGKLGSYELMNIISEMRIFKDRFIMEPIE